MHLSEKGLLNKVKFLGLITKIWKEDQWDCEIVIHSTSHAASTKFLHLYLDIPTLFEWVWCKVFNVAR